MELKCPYCGEEVNINDIHRHLIDTHTDTVETEYDEETKKMRYIIACPLCPLKYQHKIKPRYRDPHFLEEFKTEIATVAFDQLLYHLAKEHGDAIGYIEPETEESDKVEEVDKE